MAAATYDDAACRLVRNHGPFPFIQSEGGFVEPSAERNKTFVEKPDLPNQPQEPSPCSGVVLSDHQLEAIIRLRQQLDLQRTPLVPFGRKTLEPPKTADGTQSGQDEKQRPQPRKSTADAKEEKQDPFTSPTWSAKMNPWERLSTHHTLNSVRNHALMQRPFVIQSDLEFVLNSVYDHSKTMWANCAEVVIQPETAGLPTWKVLRNTRVTKPDEVLKPSPYAPKTPPPGAPGGPIGAPLYGGPQTSLGARQSQGTAQLGAPGLSVPALGTVQSKTSVSSSQTILDLPLRYGGITEKLSPHSVKLAISGNHVSQTNDGYSRKVDGTFFS